MNLSGNNIHTLRYSIWDYKLELASHEIPVRLFSPQYEKILPVIIFFHGGGWVTGNINSYTRMCEECANITNRRVLSVDYRLAPEYKFPAGLEDCYAVVREISLKSNLFSVNLAEMAIMGDSAGGNIAAALSLMARDRGEFKIKKQILIYPATYYDHSENSPFPSIKENGIGQILTARHICDYIDLYKSSDEDLKSSYFAPLNETDLSEQPDTLIITAELDPLRDEGEEYGIKLKEAGNKVKMYRIKEACHGFFSESVKHEPDVAVCYKMINAFLNNSAL